MWLKIWPSNNIGLLFIDALHDYESVRKDFELWFPRMCAGGFVAFHDVDQPGPNRLVGELVENARLVPMGLRESLFIFKSSQNHTGSFATAAERRFWNEYVRFVGSNYEQWLATEKEKHSQLILDEFDRIIERLHACPTRFPEIDGRKPI